MPIIVTKKFSASENGIDIDTYEPGEHEELPEVALAHGLAIGAIDPEPASSEGADQQKGPAPKTQAKKTTTKSK